MFVDRDSVLYSGREQFMPKPALPRSKRFKVGEWVEQIEDKAEWGRVMEVSHDEYWVTYRLDKGETYIDVTTDAFCLQRTRKRYKWPR